MEIKEALELILDLASGNMIDDDEDDVDLIAERVRQNVAYEVVENYYRNVL